MNSPAVRFLREGAGTGPSARVSGSYLLGAGVAALVVTALLLWLADSTSHRPAFGDVPTWIAVAAAAVGIPSVIYQFIAQREQLAEQRKQLSEQQKTIAKEFARQQKRDMLLDEQLREIRDRGRALERQQAEKIDLSFTVTTDTWAPGNLNAAPGGFHIAVVGNNSNRPIRDVVCHISPDGSAATLDVDRIGKHVVTQVASIHIAGTITDFINSSRLDVMRVGETWAFVFSFPKSRYPGAQMSVTFIDDAGLKWCISHDLHLERIAA